MSVWFCIPSARPMEDVAPVLAKWKQKGYKVALFLDDLRVLCGVADRIMNPATGKYPGYSKAVNAIVFAVLQEDPSCDWIVTGGDDTEPDPNHTAEEIAAQCSNHFGSTPRLSTISIAEGTGTVHLDRAYETFGVMQPTGDRFAGGSIDRIAGSPWLGREWCLRANGGKGPLWPEYTHMFADEELQNVATKLGVFWQRPDLIHFHNHFMRETTEIDSDAVVKQVPEFLKEANSPEHWAKYKALFTERKAAGFPGSEPL